ncbi:hypothetical protein TNCV_3416161 [Trichonephila clavipes]|nr:hypothetical protein TNCV_3416161 [Trichonephila clavipes]
MPQKLMLRGTFSEPPQRSNPSSYSSFNTCQKLIVCNGFMQWFILLSARENTWRERRPIRQINQRFKSKLSTYVFAPLPQERARKSAVFETTSDPSWSSAKSGQSVDRTFHMCDLPYHPF